MVRRDSNVTGDKTVVDNLVDIVYIRGSKRSTLTDKKGVVDMNTRGLSMGLFFRLQYGDVIHDDVYVTDASDEVFTLHYKNSTSYAELKKNLERDKYQVNKFEPPHLLRY